MTRITSATGQKRMCPRCRKALVLCRCAKKLTVPATDGVVRVRREVRNGKTATVVLGVPLPAAQLKDLGRELKLLCGTGGTVKDGAIEIQGDHRDSVVAALQAKGYSVKLAGG